MSTDMALEEEFAKAPLDRATWGRLLRYFRPYRGTLTLALAMEALWVVSMLVDPILIRHVVDGPLAVGDVLGVAVLAGLMLANMGVRAYTTTLELRTTTRVGVRVLDTVRRDVFRHVQRLSMRYFDRTKQGRIIARADRDVDTLEHLVMWGPIMLTMTLLSSLLGTTYLVTQHPGLGMWFLAAAPLIFATTRLFHHFGFPAYRRVRETHSAISAHVAESITGIRVVQAFCAERRGLDRLEERQGLYRSAVVRAARISAAYIPALSVTFFALLVLILVIGGRAVVAGEMTVGGLLEFVLLLGFVLAPIEALGGLYNECLIAGAAAERIFLLLDTDPEVADGPDAVDPGRLTGAIEFDHVSFSYDPSGAGGRQLDDVTFSVAPGETVALVGHTGAGKTSIINLLSRFYEAQEGEVRLDGVDIRKIRLDALHNQTGIVLQENFLFAGTVLDNLRFVSPDLTLEDALQGFENLGCAAVLAQFPDGLATDVGERGANLSEGERQIVCFVRARLADPTLLILDEATSAVDTRTEALLLKALRRLASRQTTVVIAHRLSTVRDADRIFVMKNGRLVERGTHDELMRQGGVYAGLYGEYALQ